MDFILDKKGSGFIIEYLLYFPIILNWNRLFIILKQFSLYSISIISLSTPVESASFVRLGAAPNPER